MKYLLIAAVFVTSIVHCQSQTDTPADTLFVKNAAAIATKIVSVDSLVLHLADGRKARLTVLDSLTTGNSVIVERLQRLFPGIDIRPDGPRSSVSFAQLVLPREVVTDDRMLTAFSSFVYYYRQYNVPNMEVQITCQWKGLPSVAFQIGAATNLSNKYGNLPYDMGYLLPDHKQLLIGHAFVGIGVSKEIGRLRGNLFFNAGERRIFLAGPTAADLSLFVSPSIEADLFDNHLRLSIGSHIYLDQPPASVQISSSSATLNIGFGYRL